MSEALGIFPEPVEEVSNPEVKIGPDLIEQTATGMSEGGVVGQMSEVSGLVMTRRMSDQAGRKPLMAATIDDLRQGRTSSK